MDLDVRNLVESLFRWTHVVSGILWVGLLWFFNWVNGPLQAALDGDTKRKVNPELLPRALWFFRWGAVWTWVTGSALSSFVYYQSKVFLEDPPSQTIDGRAWLMIAVTFLAFALYEPVMKAVSNAKAQAAIGFVFVTAFYLAMRQWAHFGFRGAFIHVGMMFGTIMAANVWMRIWPNQRRIIAALKSGEKPDAAWGAIAGTRSKHNTYMSVPLVFAMIAQHGTWAASGDWSLPLVVAAGWGVVVLLYRKSAALKGF